MGGFRSMGDTAYPPRQNTSNAPHYPITALRAAGHLLHDDVSFSYHSLIVHAD